MTTAPTDLDGDTPKPKRVRVISRPNMKKYGTIYEAEVNGTRLLRADGYPRRFATSEAAQKAGELA
jgi:hypothetical protein